MSPDAQPTQGAQESSSGETRPFTPSQAYTREIPVQQARPAEQASETAPQAGATVPQASVTAQYDAPYKAAASDYAQAAPASDAAAGTYAQPSATHAAPAYKQPSASNASAAGSVASPAASATAKSPNGWLKAVIGAVIGAVVATVITLCASGAIMGATSSGTQQTSGGSTTINVEGEDTTLAEAVSEKALPSVVCIYVYTEQTSGNGFFGQQSTSEQLSSLGSGVILSEDGYVITNNHVIEGESSLKVSVNGGQYDATVVGTDESSDLAVIKIEGADNLTPIEVGSSADLKVGEWVMTVGSPYGMEQSVATGIVSAVNRTSESLQSSDSDAIYANLIQTDAAINPGNSGGALVDSEGKLVGINTLNASYSGSNSGVGFAIPSDYAITIADEIIAGETPSHAQLGVSVMSIDQEMASRYQLSTTGAYVAAASGGAAEAGIEEGDIITKIDDTEVTSANDVILAVRSKSPGDTVTVEYNRNGEAKSVEVTLGSDADSSSSSESSSTESESESGGSMIIGGQGR